MNPFFRITFILIFCFSVTLEILAQSRSTGINNPDPSEKAALDIRTTSGFYQGVLVPSFDAADTLHFQMTSASAEKGLFFYDKTHNLFQYWNGRRWLPVGTLNNIPGPGGTGDAGKMAYWINPNTLSFSSMQTNGTSFGMGTAPVDFALLRLVTSSQLNGIHILNSTANGVGVSASSTSGGTGLQGSSGTGRGIYGQSTALTGIGGYFENTGGGTALRTGAGNVMIENLSGSASALVQAGPTGILSRFTGSLVSGTGAAGKVAVWNDATTVGTHSDLNWNSTTGRLHIGGSGFFGRLTVDNILFSGTEIKILRSGEAHWSVNNNTDGNLEIGTSSTGSFTGTPITPLFTITTSGRVGIGTTLPEQALHVDGNICYTGGIAACSDLRYKTSIAPLRNVLRNLRSVRGVYYHWKTVEFKDRNFDTTRQIGVIAQEIEALYPELVLTDSKGYKSVDYSRLTPLLLEAVKEQQEIIDSLKSRNNWQDKQLEMLKSQVEEQKKEAQQSNSETERELLELKEEIRFLKKAVYGEAKKK